MKTRVLVTGSMGRLGRKLIPLLLKNEFEVIATDRFQTTDNQFTYFPLELTDDVELLHSLNFFRPDVIINTAAMTDVDMCEIERDIAYQINTTVPRLLSEYAFRHQSYLIQISTDYVFDGNQGPYSETDKPKPINYYGHTKLEAEKYVLSVPERNAVVRTCVLFGYEPNANKDFVSWLVGKFRNSESVRIVNDQFSTPTSTDDLSEGLVKLLYKKGKGIFHIAGLEYVSRLEFAMLIAEVGGFPKTLIQPIQTAELKQTAKRPLKGGLSSEYSRSFLAFQPSSLKENINFYFKQENHVFE